MNEQGSPEWFLDRCGHATASEFSSVLAKGQGKTRAAYVRRVVAECVTGKPIEGGFRNSHTERGHDQEPHAGLAYEAHTGEPILRVGFLKHATLRAGCSPDGLIGSDGGVEIKCVIPTVQLDTILGKDYPSEHKAQVQGSLWITGRQWWDLVSYSPDMPEHLRLYVFRVKRDEEYIANLEREVRAFLTEVDAMVGRLMQIGVPLEEQLQASLKEAA